jgi:hypothetical protein
MLRGVADPGCLIPDQDLRIFSYRIPDPTSYVKRGVAKADILFLAAYGFRGKF